MLDALADRVLIADGAMGTMLQAADLDARRLRGARGLQRDPQRDPARRRARRARRLPGGRRGLRGDQHVRRQPRPTSASTTSPTGSASCPRPARGSPGRPPTRYATAAAAPVRARLDRARAPSCPPWATPPTRRCATRTRRTPPACSPAASDALIVETCQDLLQVKAAVVGAKRAMAELGQHGAAHLPRDGGDHRHDAARQRDRRGADRARAAGHRPDRAELRHRPGRDDRAPALPVAARPGAAVGDAQRRPAGADRRRARTSR